MEQRKIPARALIDDSEVLKLIRHGSGIAKSWAEREAKARGLSTTSTEVVPAARGRVVKANPAAHLSPAGGIELHLHPS